MRATSLLTFLVSALPFVVVADVHGHHARKHHEIAKRAPAEVATFDKRGQTMNNARFTFFDVGLGACGQTNVASDFIVALNSPQYIGGSPGPECFKMITISYGGKTTQAQIMDECPGCPWGGLDMSRGLFDFFSSEDAGVIYGSWYYTSEGGGNGGGNNDPPTTTSKKPHSTWTPPTSTWTPPTSTWTPPTSTWEPPSSSSPPPSSSSKPKPTSTSSSSKKSSSSSSSKTSSSSSSSSSSSAAPSIDYNTGDAAKLATPTGTVTGISGLGQVNQVIIQLGALVRGAQN